MRARPVPALALLALLAVVVASPAAADFPQDPPDDPAYDRAEPHENPGCAETAITQEQYHLYSFLPACAPHATDPEGASGMSVDAVWRDYTVGRADVLIAYVEGGINWHEGGNAAEMDFHEKVWLNPGELPEPTAANGYVDNGDPWFNALDWPDTPDHNGNGIVDAEDLIVEYSDGIDNDGNGYVDDISGWDFYTDQNDPAWTDDAYDHANGQMRRAAATTNNGLRLAGICPHCSLLPIKAGAEALDRTDDLAEAWLFAADSGADVIVSVTAELGYSTFMQDAIEHIAARGIVMVEASNDFNSTDHQGGQFHPYVLPGNGMVANSRGLETTEAGGVVNAATTGYRVRSGFTSWGTQNVFTAATQGGTTSEATPTVGGIVAMVLAYGRDAAEAGLIDAPLDGWEAIQVLRATSSDVDDPANPWPNQPGWDLQYGYGRPNLLRAVQAIEAGDVPPVAILRTPRWYTVVDPSAGGELEVTGTVRAPRADAHQWQLEYALGPEPAEGAWVTLAAGETAGEQTVSGTLDLSEVPEDHHAAPMTLSETKTYETAERYAVTFRLRVTDDQGRVGEDRRAIYTHHDGDWVDGFPYRLSEVGADSQPLLADLAGLGHLQIVVPDTDGRLHAIDPLADGGPAELPGFPVTLDPTVVTHRHDGVDPRWEPAPQPPALADLEGDGELAVIVTSTTGKVYAFRADGSRVPGWPVRLDAGGVTRDLPIPRPQTAFARPPTVGAVASPVVWDVDGDGGHEVIQAGWDGHLHVIDGDGTPVPGWPVKVALPEGHTPGPGRFVIQDEKLSVTPALADLDGDGEVEIVVKTQYGETRSAGLQPNGASNVMAYHLDGTPVDGWPATLESTVMFYGSAQEYVTEGVAGVAVADVDGDGDDEVVTNPLFTWPYVIQGDGSVSNAYGAAAGADAGFAPAPAPSVGALLDGLPADIVVGFTTTGAFGEFNGTLSFAQTGSSAASIVGSLLLPGSGLPIEGFERVFEAASGAAHPGFPAPYQGLNFIGAPLFADLDGDGAAEVVDGGDTNAVHAYTAAGGQAAGFPKWHSGWNLWSPSVGDLDGDGDVELVVATREGYLFAWDTAGRTEANDQWWSWKHDEWNTGRYGVDSRPPGILRDAEVVGDGALLEVTTPGDDWYAGEIAGFRVTADGQTTEHPITIAAGATVRIPLPDTDAPIRVQAYDDAGNLGRAHVVGAAPPPPVLPAPPDLPATGGGALAVVGLLVLGMLGLLARGVTSAAARPRRRGPRAPRRLPRRPA